MDKLLTVKDVCKIFNIERATLYSWISKKRIPVVKISGRMVRFKMSEIERWLSQKSQNEEGRKAEKNP